MIRQDGTGEGPKLPTFVQKDVTGAALLAKMGQANKKGEVLRVEVIKFEKDVRFNFIVRKHPHLIKGPRRLSNMRIDGRCGSEIFGAAVSDFIRTYEQWLPLHEFNNSEYVRYSWIYTFLTKMSSAIRSGAAGTSKERGVKRVKNTDGEDKDGSVKRAKNEDIMVRVVGSVANQSVQPYPNVRKFTNLVNWIDRSAKPTSRQVRLHAQYKCVLDMAQAADLGVAPGQVFEREVYDQDTWDSEVENFLLVARPSMVIVLEVRLATEGDGGEAAKCIVDMDATKELEPAEMVGQAHVNLI